MRSCIRAVLWPRPAGLRTALRLRRAGTPRSYFLSSVDDDANRGASELTDPGVQVHPVHSPTSVAQEE